MFTIQQATAQDTAHIAPLFNGYRQFYGKADDLAACEAFLTQRLGEGSSIVLFATDDSGARIGFTQLYPLFSSTRLVKTLLLNDLFCAPSARRQGVGAALLKAAQAYAAAHGYASLSLETAHTNVAAQALYEKLGWQQDTVYRTYTLVA